MEWIVYDSAPLMFTHEVSRIPAIPGNRLVESLVATPCVAVSAKSLLTILILSSFRPGDPVAKALDVALGVYEKDGSHDTLDIRRAYVQSELELISALNSFDGNVLVFDCHGNHGGEHEEGWLLIGDERVNTWNLAYKCRIPPIVMLSACSTHAIDGSYASVAGGLLRCGALSVIGTFAPVAAFHASVFVARLLHRIGIFIPLLISMKEKPVTWREIVSGFFRMSYATDILRGFHLSEKLISSDQYIAMHVRANMSINSGSREWLSAMICDICANASISEAEVKEKLRTQFSFVDTMLYTHLGRPENLLIYQED